MEEIKNDALDDVLKECILSRQQTLRVKTLREVSFHE